MPRRSLFLRIVAGVSLAIVTVLYVALIWAVFINDDKPLTSLSPQGPNAQAIQNLIIPVFAIAGVVFVGVIGAVLYISWRFREHLDDDGSSVPHQLHGNTKLEIGWTILPAVILAFVAVLTVIVIIDLEEREPDALHVQVSGQQWWWQYKYDLNDNGSYDDPEDLTTANELVIPTDRQIALSITSNDVIHSFWIPALNGKKDAVPGITSDWNIEASDEGVFLGQCTEFCGLSHANMRMVVRAVSTENYDAWVANQTDTPREPAEGSEAAAGKAQFESLCSTCHVVNGVFEDASDTAEVPLVSGVAPNLTHLMTRGTFAGSIYNLYTPQDPDSAEPAPGDAGDVSLPGDPGDALYGGDSAPYEINRTTLEAWLRNPPAMKPAYAQGERGMPNLGLSEEQIDQLVAYLETLK